MKRLLNAVWPCILFAANIWLLVLVLFVNHWLVWVACAAVLAIDYNLYKRG